MGVDAGEVAGNLQFRFLQVDFVDLGSYLGFFNILLPDRLGDYASIHEISAEIGYTYSPARQSLGYLTRN